MFVIYQRTIPLKFQFTLDLFLSIRELTKVAYEYSECLLRELIWNSFFSQILWHNPHVISHPFKKNIME